MNESEREDKMIRFGAIVLIVFLAGSCTARRPPEELSYPAEEMMDNSFSRFYDPVEFTSSPAMEQMGLPVEQEEIININKVMLYTRQLVPPDELLQNGFAVFPTPYGTDNPVRAFQWVKDSDNPVFVSSGIPLHMLHIFFDQILQQVETDHLYPALVTICTALYESSINRNDMLAASYFAVPLTFLTENFQPHSSIAETVREETELMRAHAGFSPSAVFGYKEDYSQYVPRGHYTASEDLENYFMAMMYMGRLTFLLKGGEPFGSDEEYLVSEEQAEEFTTTALLIVSDLNTIQAEGAPLKDKWQRVYEITAFFAGFADDLSVDQYQTAAEATSGEEFQLEHLESDSFRGSFLEYIVTSFQGPSIYSGTGAVVVMPDGNGEFDPADFMPVLAKTVGFRLFGQRYTPDSEMLGKFVFPSIGTNPDGARRFMPSGLDVAASFRCAAALEILENNGDMLYDNYPDTLSSMQDMVDSYSNDDWHATLYMCWLHSLHLLAEPREAGYPDFMQTDSWNRCTLSTFLASWAMLRHDTILYAKQSYTMEAGCAPSFEEPVPSAGFVEPVPEVYAELRATLIMAGNGLEYYNLTDETLEMRFDRAEDLLGRIQEIAEKELAGELLSENDADFLKNFAGALEGTIAWGGDTEEGLETSLIADVHTDQNSSSVLEVASGNLDNCVIIYRRADGVTEAAVGPVLSYYQFQWPMADRLTDEAWREMLQAGTPERPRWTEEYIVE